MKVPVEQARHRIEPLPVELLLGRALLGIDRDDLAAADEQCARIDAVSASSRGT